MVLHRTADGHQQSCIQEALITILKDQLAEKPTMAQDGQRCQSLLKQGTRLLGGTGKSQASSWSCCEHCVLPRTLRQCKY